MKRINLPLWAGLLICAVIILFMAVPGVLAPNSPYTIQVMRSLVEDGSLRFETAPYPPSPEFAMGTDDHGRDIWSQIVYGTRLTITLALLIVLGRFVIALPVAIAAAFGNNFSRSLVRQFGVLFSAIPALLISIIVLRQDLFVSMDKGQSTLAFVVVLSLVGWAKLGTLVMERTESILRQPYIRSEVAIGKRPFHIATENVVPHLAPELVVLVFMEVARSLAILMQLGIFGVFVGNLRIIESTDEGAISVFNTSFEPEWASMLGTAGQMINAAPWMVLYPALAFFVSVFGFNLLGEGLRNSLQGADATFVPVLRKMLRFDVKSVWRSTAKPARIAVLVLTGLLVVLLLVPRIVQSGGDRFDSGRHTNDLETQVLTGTEPALLTANLIRERMKLLGVEPMRAQGYFLDYGIAPASIPSASEFVVQTEDERVVARIGIDFSFLSLDGMRVTRPLFDATKQDLLTVADYDVFADSFVLIDKAFYSEPTVDHIVASLQANADPPGILLIARRDEPMTNSISETNSGSYVVLLSRQFGEQVANAPGASPSISISATAEPLGTGGRNVVGVLPGVDPAISDEAIFIGIPYNYTAEMGPGGLAFGLELMERVCSEHKSRRSVIFAFLDGTLEEQHHGIRAVMDQLSYNSADIEIYLDLARVRAWSFDSVTFSAVQAPITRYYAWSFAHQLERQFAQQKMATSGLPAENRGGEYYFTDQTVDNEMFWGYGIATVVLGTEPAPEGSRDMDDLGAILLRVMRMNNQ